MNSPRGQAKALMLVGVAVVMGVAGGLTAMLLLKVPSTERTGPEKLLDESFYRPTSGLYHVADVQSRPRVTAAIERLRTANLCEFIFKLQTAKMNSDMTYGRGCEGAIPDDRHWNWNESLRFDPGALAKGHSPAPFAVLIDRQRNPYLLAPGKNGSLTADELEALVVAVLEQAVEIAPQVRVAKQRELEAEAQKRREDEEKQRRAAETFK